MAGPPRRTVGPADLLTVVRLPLAAAFVLVDGPLARLGVLAVAGLSDLLDGIVARRVGPSRVGVWLDPVCDKTFTVTAFLVIVTAEGAPRLAGWEWLGLVARDLAVLGGWIATRLVFRRTLTLPALWSGKVVTALQFATLGALLLGWTAARPLAWATAAASVWAVADLTRAVLRRYRDAGRPPPR